MTKGKAKLWQKLSSIRFSPGYLVSLIGRVIFKIAGTRCQGADSSASVTGGIARASLDHRLHAGIPPGCLASDAGGSGADGGVEAEGGERGEGKSDDESGVARPFAQANGPREQQDDGGGDEEGEGEPDRFREVGKVEPLAEGL